MPIVAVVDSHNAEFKGAQVLFGHGDLLLAKTREEGRLVQNGIGIIQHHESRPVGARMGEKEWTENFAERDLFSLDKQVIQLQFPTVADLDNFAELLAELREEMIEEKEQENVE